MARGIQLDEIRNGGLGRHASAGNGWHRHPRYPDRARPITSEIRRNSIPHFEKWIDAAGSARADEYESRLKPRLYDDSGAPDRFELPASAVTKAVSEALTQSNPKPRYRITTPTRMMAVLKRLLPTRMLDKVLLRA